MKPLTARFACLIATLLLAACASPPQGLAIDRSISASGQDSRVLFIVLHYTVGGFSSALKTLTQGQVSSHYLVSDEPVRIHGLVDENRRAWHAGPSQWQSHANLNASSIGIEIVNPGYAETPAGRVYAPFAPAQIDAVVALVKDVARRHEVRPDRILGHNEVAPQLKQDPGPAFPWKRLADEGLIPWPDAIVVNAKRPEFELQPPDVAWYQRKLAEHGFAVPQSGLLDTATRNVISTFQMKYRPSNIAGQPDAETAALLYTVTSPGGLLMLRPSRSDPGSKDWTSRW
nr:N-acetylmuramoyl-L-alanine amidase [uncultured Roseateles sp.]